MPFDDDLVLIDGTATLGPTTDTAATSTTRNADGAVVLDIKKTGTKGLVAVMVCPTAPTTYADTLTGLIQHSNHISTGWETVASFPVLYDVEYVVASQTMFSSEIREFLSVVAVHPAATGTDPDITFPIQIDALYIIVRQAIFIVKLREFLSIVTDHPMQPSAHPEIPVSILNDAL